MLQRVKDSFGTSSVPVPPSSLPPVEADDAPFIRSINDKYTVAAAVAAGSVRSSNAAEAESSSGDGSKVAANSDRLRAIARARIEQAQQRARARQQESAQEK